MKQAALTTQEAYTLMLNDFPDVMDIQQMSAALRVCDKTCYRLLRDGSVSSLRIGRSYRIPKANLLAYLQADSCTLQ